MKEVIGKTRKSQVCLSRKLVIGNVEITGQKHIANEFNEFFKNLAPKLASNIPNPVNHSKLLKQPAEVFCKKKMFLEISQNSQEGTCASASFLIKLQG